MGKLKTTPFDTADYLRTPEERARFLEIMIEETNGDPFWVMDALSVIARSEGMTKVAREAKVSRESLYKSLSGKRDPGFSTIHKVMTALGLQFRVVPLPSP